MVASLVTLLGLATGSFLAVVVGRGKGLFAQKRSFCDQCKRKLSWWENIPVLSFLILRGKCRTCHSPIPPRYLGAELFSGLIFLFTFLHWQEIYQEISFSSLAALFLWLIIGSFLLLIALVDWRKMIIPDWAVLVLLCCSLLNHFLHFSSGRIFLNYLLSGLGAAGFLFSLHILTKGKGMGFGDVKLAVFIGLFLGFPRIVLALYLAVLTGAVFGVIMILLGKAKLKKPIPFGPFLVWATFLTWWWGEYIFGCLKLFLSF